VRITAGRLLTTADLAATCLFAIEGAIVARAADLDVFGILVIGFVSALVGGIVRDVLIGYTPPASLRSALYPITAFAGAGLVIVLARLVEQTPLALLQLTDAAGLALFAVVGATKATDFRINWFVATMLGAVSAVGGGVTRDLLLNVVPGILRQDVYAVAALAGAGATVLALHLKLPRAAAMAIGFAVCFGLRMLSIWLGWNLPRP
jgi:uncharacterized membrane protein YeiH